MGSVSVESGNGHSSTVSGSIAGPATPQTPRRDVNWGKNATIQRRKGRYPSDGGEDDSQDQDDDLTETADDDDDVIDETGADDAFVAGTLSS